MKRLVVITRGRGGYDTLFIKAPSMRFARKQIRKHLKDQSRVATIIPFRAKDFGYVASEDWLVIGDMP